MPWAAILHTVSELDAALVKTGNRIDTARQRGDQLSWQNHREQYSRRVRKVRSLHRNLKRTLSGNVELSELLEDMQDPLSTVCDVESSTSAKYEKFQTLIEQWDQFRDSLDGVMRSEHDIFLQREIAPDQGLCFVLMPFDETFRPLYRQVIRPSVTRTGLRCARADDIFSSNIIVQDVWTGINKARVVVADMTNRNPNVFYEIGLAHTLRQPVVLLSQKREDIPFDLRHIRYIFYSDTVTGRRQLSSRLTRTLRNLLR